MGVTVGVRVGVGGAVGVRVGVAVGFAVGVAVGTGVGVFVGTGCVAVPVAADGEPETTVAVAGAAVVGGVAEVGGSVGVAATWEVVAGVVGAGVIAAVVARSSSASPPNAADNSGKNANATRAKAAAPATAAARSVPPSRGWVRRAMELAPRRMTLMNAGRRRRFVGSKMAATVSLDIVARPTKAIPQDTTRTARSGVRRPRCTAVATERARPPAATAATTTEKTPSPIQRRVSAVRRAR